MAGPTTVSSSRAVPAPLDETYHHTIELPLPEMFSRRYLAPYETALGQVVLAVVAMYWAGGFWWMHRMGRVAPTERFLANPSRLSR